MTKKKWYGVKCLDGTEKSFDNWSACQKAVMGVPGVIYKSFTTKADLEKWLETQRCDENNRADKGIKVYVDGSYKPGYPYAGYGWAAIKEDEIIASGSGISDTPAESRNIDGELLAAMEAILWISSQKISATICYDYAGIKEWAKGTWKASKPVSINYQNRISSLCQNIKWEKIKGHSGDKWNDYVDQLAKDAIDQRRGAVI